MEDPALQPGAVRLYELRIRRRQVRGFRQNAILGHPEQAADLFRRTFVGESRECFVSFHIDIRNRLVGYELIAIGNVHTVQVHPREVFRGAILSSAVGIIVAHNHPSGDPEPSHEDDVLTKRLWLVGRVVGIPVVDHVVVTDSHHYSYGGNNRMPTCETPDPY